MIFIFNAITLKDRINVIQIKESSDKHEVLAEGVSRICDNRDNAERLAYSLLGQPTRGNND